ncbi:hypothetical protein BM477_04755 [Boudabousia marimammalium]|uniref:HK97 gp10 family phage protein n=1 Tax=Boudabousia marimammalium TaxID=156892 RepID=A0A1Q5PPC1_9ACTO|nr:hypothetical protein BM477_04755 [Boudabousia marimammalium]
MKVTGLNRTLRQLEQAGAAAGDMKDLMHQIGESVIERARPAVPRGKSGKLARSLRAGRGKTKAVVRAGGARVPYAGVIHYGWPAHHIRPQPFYLTAMQAAQTQILDQLNQGISDLLEKADLK